MYITFHICGYDIWHDEAVHIVMEMIMSLMLAPPIFPS